MQNFMVAFHVDLTNGTTKSGQVAVTATDPDAALRKVAGLIRRTQPRYECFNDFWPDEVEDISVTYLGPA